MKECPCVAWMARKGKYSSFNGYFLYFKLARNASITGCPRMLLQRPGVDTLDTLATNCIQKWFNFPSQWCVHMAHALACNVWIPIPARESFFSELQRNESSLQKDMCGKCQRKNENQMLLKAGPEVLCWDVLRPSMLSHGKWPRKQPSNPVDLGGIGCGRRRAIGSSLEWLWNS